MSPMMVLAQDVLVDMPAAISIAYEKPELEIMKQKPRDIHWNIISMKGFAYAYFQIGVMITLIGLLNYFIIFAAFGFPPWMLWMSTYSGHFLSTNANLNIPLTNAVGILVSGVEQVQILEYVQAGYFFTVFLCQQFNLANARTKRESWFSTDWNWILLLCRIWAASVTAMIIYIPGLNTAVFGIEAISPLYWLPPLPFALLIFFYNELRKLVVRFYENGVIDQITVY